MKEVYLDYAATSPLDSKVLEAMMPYFSEDFGNPSSFHTLGKVAKDAMDGAREDVARILGARALEIIFTSGGTESDNLAIMGTARANQEKGKHIITSAVEHQAVLETLHYLEREEGFEITYLLPDGEGMISAEQVENEIRPDTILISLMYANNEIGTIWPIEDIGKMIVKKRGAGASPIFHTDACQAPEYLDMSVEKLHVDLLTLNGGKIYGPKGAGVLYIRKGTTIKPIMFGGHQQKGWRPGTENVAGCVGLAKALAIAQKNRHKESERLSKLRDKLIGGIQKQIPKTYLNGHPTKRLPNNANVSFWDVEGEALMLYLDAQGIFVSTGSACTSASLDPSHVLVAIGKPFEQAHGSIRFSLGRATTSEDIDYVLEVLPGVVKKLREISPLNLEK